MMKKKILVVDDSATARMLFKVCLQGQTDDKYELLQASSWQEALSLSK
ncbi:MAG: hypothetical protein K0U24_03395 [Gammaproteobacteria bacterium]|jgi:CheY-like chemotaxis protein|nr:hypothetical protein [Gammaproteobacteria bacterium]MCH9763261.1 hypothetical protein [Gammaproteobacteria bacterium]